LVCPETKSPRGEKISATKIVSTTKGGWGFKLTNKQEVEWETY